MIVETQFGTLEGTPEQLIEFVSMAGHALHGCKAEHMEDYAEPYERFMYEVYGDIMDVVGYKKMLTLGSH